MTISAKHLLAAAATTALFAGTAANAASLAVDFQATLSSEQHPTYSGEGRFYHVSVNPANPGIGSYAATIVGTNDPAPTFTRPFVLSDVLAYKAIGGTNNDISGISLSGGEESRLQYDTDDTSFDGFGQNIMKFWDVTDPGADLQTTVADPFAAVADANPSGYRSLGGVNGTVDVTGLTSGSFYIFYASFNATPTVNVVLKDTDGVAPDISIADAHLNGDAANRSEHYVAELDFETDGVYDTIEFEFLANGADYLGNGRGFSSLLIGSTAVALPGDTDGDGDIDDSDLGTSFANYTGPVGAAGGKTAAEGDTDGDGDVDDSDLGTSFSGYTGPQSPAAVPEPTSLALLGLGGLLVARRRRA